MARSKIKYQTDEGTILNMYLDNAKVALAGDAPAGAVTQSNILVSPNISKRKRNVLRARGWRYTYSEPTESGLFAYKNLFLPKVTTAAWLAEAPTTATYKGTVYTFVNRETEG